MADSSGGAPRQDGSVYRNPRIRIPIRGQNCHKLPRSPVRILDTIEIFRPAGTTVHGGTRIPFVPQRAGVWAVPGTPARLGAGRRGGAAGGRKVGRRVRAER